MKFIQLNSLLLLTSSFLLLTTISAQNIGNMNISTCVDEPDSVVSAIFAAAGYDQIDSCSSPILATAIDNGLCKEQTPRGRKIREICCRTCYDYYFPLPETQLPSNDGGILGDPVKLYLQAGQSECVGQASTNLLRQYANTSGEYSDLVTEQEDVYYAGYASAPTPDGNRGPTDASRFFISKMEIGKERATTFGPEIAIGRRLQDASPSDEDITIVKYCWGGSKVATHWNPSTSFNDWDRGLDDGSSQYLLDDGAAALDSKDNLYGNLIYTARRTAEALTDAGVNYEWSGLFWLQGNGDRESTWEEYGTNLKRLFSQVRDDLGVPNLPIVDEGAGPQHNLYSGKIFTASTIPGCNVKVANPNFGVLDPESDCDQSASNVCLDSFNNYGHLEFYGVDPGMTVPPFSDLIPEELLNKNFTWYKQFPTNQHSEYDGMILKGRMMANEFVRTFTDWSLTAGMIADDPLVLFPPVSCGRPEDLPSYTAPGPDNVCYVDERDDAAIASISCNVDTGEPLSIVESRGLRKKT